MSSNKNVLLKASVAETCQPVRLELICDPDCPGNFAIRLADGGILFKRRDIKAANSITLCIENPIYFGCNTVDLSSSFINQGPWSNVSIVLTDTDAKGDLAFDRSVNTLWNITATSTHYQWRLKFTPSGDELYHALCDFDGCNFEFKFADTFYLTNTNGYPLCNSFDVDCMRVCGDIKLCGVELPALQANKDVIVITEAQARGIGATTPPSPLYNVVTNDVVLGDPAASSVLITADDITTLQTIDLNTGDVTWVPQANACEGNTYVRTYTITNPVCSSHFSSSTFEVHVDTPLVYHINLPIYLEQSVDIAAYNTLLVGGNQLLSNLLTYATVDLGDGAGAVGLAGHPSLNVNTDYKLEVTNIPSELKIQNDTELYVSQGTVVENGSEYILEFNIYDVYCPTNKVNGTVTVKIVAQP